MIGSINLQEKQKKITDLNTHHFDDTACHDEAMFQGIWCVLVKAPLYVKFQCLYLCTCNIRDRSVVVGTDLSGREPRGQLGVNTVITLGRLGGVMVSMQAPGWQEV